MEAHLRSNFPERASSLDPPALSGVVQSGIDQAAKYGIETEPDIRRYLELALQYGAAFDADPKCAWASEILNRTDLDGTQKINLLDQYELFELPGGAQ